MTVRLDRSIATPATGRKHPELLCGRMAMLGIDRGAIEQADSQMFDKLEQRCAGCEYPQACALDLEHDPTNPVWEAYCPNSALLTVLTAA
jgi:hypothetical protein